MHDGMNTGLLRVWPLTICKTAGYDARKCGGWLYHTVSSSAALSREHHTLSVQRASTREENGEWSFQLCAIPLVEKEADAIVSASGRYLYKLEKGSFK